MEGHLGKALGYRTLDSFSLVLLSTQASRAQLGGGYDWGRITTGEPKKNKKDTLRMERRKQAKTHSAVKRQSGQS
jgi:hypothetical protein